MPVITPGCPLCDARLAHGICAPRAQVIRPPSITTLIEDPDWTPAAAASDQELRETIVRAIRRKLHASNDLRDLRARDAAVHFEWAVSGGSRVQAVVGLRWRVDGEHDALAIGYGELGMFTEPWRAWWEAARNALRNLGV
jgi:hypothetical protein